MKKAIIRILQVTMFPFYFCAYVLAHVLRMKDRENMPTIKEWWFDEIEEREEE